MQLQELMLDVCSGLSHLKFQYWLYHSIINTKALFLSLLEVGMACIAVNLPSMWFLISHVTPEAVLRSIRSVVSLQSLRSTKSRQSLKDKTMRSSSYPWGGTNGKQHSKRIWISTCPCRSERNTYHVWSRVKSCTAPTGECSRCGNGFPELTACLMGTCKWRVSWDYPEQTDCCCKV